MTANPARQSTVLKAVTIAVRWTLWLLASVWITLAMVWGGLHFLIVPRIAEWRPWFEQQATKALGIAVQIGAVTTRTNGLIPSFELSDVRLLDKQGRAALRLPRVLAALSPRSVLGGGFEQLYIDQPVLDVRRTPDGTFWIAGLALTGGAEPDSAALDWLFSQSELAIRSGTISWTDEMRGAEPLILTDLDWVLRNRHSTHAVRLDATPPALWGERLSVSGVFRQPLLSHRSGQWQDLDGQLFASFTQLDLAQLRRYADVGVDVAHGSGTLRAWLDVSKGQPTGATVDVALREVNVRTERQLEPLAFRWIAGRLGARALRGGIEVSTQALEFDTQDGLHWPGGNVRLGLFPATAAAAEHGEIAANRLDLAAMAEIAARLPIDDAVRTQLTSLEPKGAVQNLAGSWDGPLDHPVRFAAKGRVEQLGLAPHVAEGRPGVRGADVDFDFSEAGGKAHVAMRGGFVHLPGLFDDPLIALDQFAGDVQWKGGAKPASLSLSSVSFSNADAQGEFQMQWQSAPVGPGLLDLQGSLSRAELNRVYRYLPSGIDREVRDYVRDAVLAGTGTAVKYKVKGNLREFPFREPRQGEFRIAASLHNAYYAYVPVSLLPTRDSPPWPALKQISAEFLIDRSVLSIKGLQAAVGGSAGLQITKADGLVSDLYDGAKVSVSAEARGPLADVLGVVNGSPLGGLTNKVLARATAGGTGEYRFKLALPIAHPERATVQGGVVFAGNEFQLTPDTPRLARVRGNLAFSETGFSLSGVQARALGGDVRLEGALGAVTIPRGAAPVLRMQGTASADGLRQARELGFIARLAQYATGTAAYSATLGVRAGVPEVLVNSNLVGLAVSLPAPFSKTAEASLPLRLETTAVRAPQQATGTANAATANPATGQRQQDQLQLGIGSLASMVFVRDVSGSDARVLRGAMVVGGGETAVLPDQGVSALVNVGSVDLDAWSRVLSQAAGSGLTAEGPAASSNNPAMGYAPTTLVIRAKTLQLGGHPINNVLLGGGRDGLLWRANLDATELNGYVEYRQSLGPAAGRLVARLVRLSVGQSTAQDVENLLDEQPASIPALDIAVDDLELRGKKLGRVEVEAVNLGATAGRDSAREWRMNRFNITTPEATLTAAGNWTNIVALSEPAVGRSIKERRRTAMKFKLDISDAGALLERFGMPGVVRRGQGKIEGRVGWLGSPITLDYASLEGNMNVNVEGGQFLKADPGIAKLLGVLSLQSLPRRLVLDFRDVFSDGFAFDFLRGDVVMERGIARTNNLQMKGVNAAVLMEGQADMAKETQHLKVVVVPEINAGSASLIASAINPLVGLSSFLAQLILRRPLIDAATKEFLIDGTWIDPRVTPVEHQSP